MPPPLRSLRLPLLAGIVSLLGWAAPTLAAEPPCAADEALPTPCVQVVPPCPSAPAPCENGPTS